LLTRSFSYSALRTYMHIPTKKLLTPVFKGLFTQGHKKSSYGIRNCLIFFVDQPGLEPGTSRL
jgi:hypothetical protein